VVVGGADLYGCFSPFAKGISAVTTPIMLIMPELLELYGGVVMPPSVEKVRSYSHEIFVLASPPSQALSFEKSGVVDVVVSLD
jgi:hypothetical protein